MDALGEGSPIACGVQRVGSSGSVVVGVIGFSRGDGALGVRRKSDFRGRQGIFVGGGWGELRWGTFGEDGMAGGWSRGRLGAYPFYLCRAWW